MAHSQFSLLGTRRFAPFFVTQSLGAFNDNVFRNATLVLIAFQMGLSTAQQSLYTNLAPALFILPFFFFSATAGQLAEKYEKTRIIRAVKIFEIVVMAIAAWGFYGHHAGLLLGLLPPIIHIRKESVQAALRWYVEQMMQEQREGQPGGFLVAQHLAHMMLVQALRVYLAEGADDGVGWFFALAEHAGMSRSVFAEKFKAMVGETPMEYLTRWRMLVAGDRLANSGDPVSVIARSLGYESESAFSTAFKRMMACSPRQYGRGQALASDSRFSFEA